MEILLTFLIYLSAASLMLLTFLGAGRPLYRLLDKSNTAMTIRRSINEFVLGFSATFIILSLLFTYIPTKWATQISIVILIALLSSGVYTETYRLTKTNSRRSVLYFWILIVVSFMLVYLPFSNTTKVFLASEGGGDLTAYLGYANVALKHTSYPVVEAPRILILMRFLMEWMGLVTVTDRPINYAELEPTMVAFHNNLTATTYWPTLFFFPLRFIFPISVLYMSLWMLLAAIVPSLIALAIPKDIKWAKLWMSMGFLLIAFSAGFQSIFLNHYIYQLLSIFMIAAFYSSLVHLVTGDSIPRLQITICFLTLAVIFISYVPASAPSLVLAAWGGMIVLLAHRWKNPNQPLASYFPSKILGWMFLLIFMLLPFFFEAFYRVPTIELVKKASPETVQLIAAVWGPKVSSFNEVWNGLQGTLIHNLAQPYTTLNLHHLWNYLLAPLSITLFLFCLFPLVLLLRKNWRSANEFWQSRLPVAFLAFGSLIIIFGFLILCNTHTYIFDKMAMLMLPVTIISMLILLSLGLDRAFGRFKVVIATTSTIFLALWLVGNAQTRFYQIKSFHKSLDRTAILYTQNYMQSLPIPKNPSRTLLYSNTTGAGTSYFLMEASLSGMNTFPANNFYHANYPSFLAKINFSRSNYVIANKKGADAYDITHFYLGNGKDFAVPIDPFLDPAASTLPKKIIIERATPEGTGIILQASHTWNVRCRPFEKQDACRMEKSMLGSIKYDPIIEQPNKDGSCLFEIKNKPGSQVLHFKQCHEISFEQVYK
jgi:hypothetical protein